MLRLLLIAMSIFTALLMIPARHNLITHSSDEPEFELDPRLRNLGLLAILSLVTSGITRVLFITLGAVLLFVVVPWLEQRPDKHANLNREKDFPQFLDYLHMCLSAGLSIADSMIRVERFIGNQLGLDVRRINELYRLGAPINDAVDQVARDHIAWQRLNEVIARSYLTGSSIKESVQVIAQYSRATSEVQTISRIRSLAVKCTLPLGLCFLPAFVVLSILPVVASLYTSMF